jgi:membrane protein CcdC involved in cytochrome C biogenesis
MINEVEKKKRKIRWWFNIISSAIIILLGLAFLVMRYFYDFNPMQEKFWMITGLLLGYGLLRFVLYFWRGRHLYDDMEDE